MTTKLKQLFDYYKQSFICDVKGNIAYPATFWFASLTIPLWSLIQILFIETIYGQTNSFLGYSKYENYVLFGTFKVVQSIASLLFFVRLEDLAEKIRGTSDWSLDMMLLKPIDSQIFATTGKFWFGAISSTVAGIGLIVYGLTHEFHAISIGAASTYIATVLIGVFFLYLLFLFIQTWLFWFEYLQIGADLWFTSQSFGQYPRALYHGGLGLLFNIFVPIPLMASIPTEFLFGKLPVINLVMYVVIVTILFVLTRKFWQYSIKKYSSFSS